jgi:hypothetical protein
MRSSESFARIERELLEERAAALARIAGRLGSLVARLAEARAEWASRPSGARPLDAPESYRRLREEARLYRWYLEVQREALGFRGPHGLDEHYPIPESLEG